jgi:hypothetical protein
LPFDEDVGLGRPGGDRSFSREDRTGDGCVGGGDGAGDGLEGRLSFESRDVRVSESSDGVGLYVSKVWYMARWEED